MARLVVDGVHKTYPALQNGQDDVVALRDVNFVVNDHEFCCLLGHSDYSAHGVAEEDVTLLSVPPGLFNELMLEFEPFRRFIFAMYSDRLAEVMELVEEVAFRRLDERLAQLLIHRGPVVDATHQKLADELGSVREIVSRLLRSFEDRGWVKLERERITVLDPKALATLQAKAA